MKDQAWIRPKRLRPMLSCGDWLVLLILVLSISGVVLWAALTDRWFVASLSVILGFCAVALFLTLHLGQEPRWAVFLGPLPTVLGLALSYHPAISNLAVYIGMVLSSAFVLWYRVLRHPPAYRSAARKLMAGDLAQTLELLQTSIERHPTHWQSYYLRALTNLYRVRFDQVEQDARAALRLQPNQHMCHVVLGSALIGQGDYAEAKAAYSRALELAPGYAITPYSKGVACFRLGEFQEAAGLLKTAVRGKLPYAEQRLFAHYYLGKSLLQLGQDPQARSSFRAMRRYRQSYERVVARYRDAPDLPGVADLRQELQEIKERLDDSET